MRKTFHTKKKLSEMGLEPGQNGLNSYFPIFYYIKILTKNLKKKSLLMKGKKGVNFLMKTDSKHQ